MITNKKIFSLAKRFSDDVESFESVNHAYRALQSERHYADYLNNLGDDAFIKLVIAMWALREKYSEKQIENIYDKLFFATLFVTEDEDYLEECSDCSGNGNVTCDYCDGNGRNECDQCSGTGLERCFECSGEGEIEGDDGPETCPECDGDKQIDCGECGGDGDVYCDECSGNGSVDCDNCAGEGSFATGEKLFNIYYIASWDSSLKNRIEMYENEIKPVMSYDKFLLDEKILILSKDGSEHADLIEEVESDEMYVIGYFSDNPKTYFQVSKNSSGDYSFEVPNFDVKHLTI